MSRRHHHALPAGYRLHWYEIESVLGQGGFGITYLAHDVNLGAKVAIKEFLPSELATRTSDSRVHPLSEGHVDTFGWGLTRFLAEAQTLAKFKHPNIVRVLAVFEANQTAYMVMEYERGVGLGEALEFSRIERDQPTLLRITLALLDGLAQVHAAGFIHRDIKPANILIREDGSPVLIDFGSARQALGRETRTLTALVSPGYAPFEQYNASAENDQQGPWTDIYSLGATLYRAVTGRAPPDAMARVGPAMQGRDILEPTTTRGGGRFQPYFLAAIDRALELLPERRPQSAAEWRAMLTGEVPARVPDGDAVTALRRRDPVGSADDEGPTVVSVHPRPPALPDESPTEVGAPQAAAVTAPRRSRSGLIAAGFVLVIAAAGIGAWLARQPAPQPLATPAGDAAATSIQPATDEAARQAEAERQRLAAEEAARQAEAERQRAAAEEAARQAEAERQRAAAEEAARQAEAERERFAAEEAARQAEAERQRAAAEEAARQAEAERERLAAEEAARQAEAERERLAAEEAARQAEAERERLAAEEAARQAEAERERAAAEAETARQAEAARLDALLAQADADIVALRLTSPPGNNAVERLREVLAARPDDASALAGLARVRDRYVGLAEEASAAGEFDRAGEMLDRAATVTPDAAEIAAARERVAAARSAAEAGQAAEAARRAEAEQAAEAARRAEAEQAAEAARRAEAERVATAEAAARRAADVPEQAGAGARAVAVLSCDVNGGAASFAALSRLSADLTRRLRARADTRLLWNSNDMAASARPLDERGVWQTRDGVATPRVGALAVAARDAGADLLVLCGIRQLGTPDGAVDVFVYDAKSGALERRGDTEPGAAARLLDELLGPAPAPVSSVRVTPQPAAPAATRIAVLGAWCFPCGTTAVGDEQLYLAGVREALATRPDIAVQSAPWDSAPAPALAANNQRDAYFSGPSGGLAKPDAQAFSTLARGAGADLLLVGMMVYRGSPPFPVNLFLVDARDGAVLRSQVVVNDTAAAVGSLLSEWRRAP